MKILWIVNIIPCDYATFLGNACTVGGGWIDSMIGQMKRHDDIQLTVVCKNDNVDSPSHAAVDGVSYVSILYKWSLKEQCRSILKDVRPDLVQIDGTEFPHATAMFNTAKKDGIPTLISMQGVLNGLYPYECGELPIDEMMFSCSLTNIFAAWTLFLRKVKWFKPRMKAEQAILTQAEYVTGRTEWDHAHLHALNPKAKYFACNRILRSPFYSTAWDISKIERHSIYVGNGYSALKGLHFMLQALPLLIRDYPDVKLYVSGVRPYEEHDKRPLTKQGYARYIKKMVKQLDLESHVIFTGPLQADGMVERFLKTHVYVLCSTIENSPNTLGEAMLVGTPCVSSYAGGAPEMAVDGKEALFYRSNDPALLAWAVKRIFDNDTLAMELSQNARQHALVTHDPVANGNNLVSIYHAILHV